MAQSTGNIGSVALVGTSAFGPNSSNATAFDDFAIDDSEWPSDGRIIAMAPNASGDEGDWDHVNQGADSQDWQAVDEIPTENVDYLHTNIPDALHSLHLEAAPSDDMDVINAVQVCLDSRKTGIPDVLNIEHMLVDSGWATPNQLSGVDKQLSSDANQDLCYCWAQNPGTSADWAKADLGSLQIGVKAKA